MRRWLLPEAIEDALPAEAWHIETLRRGLLDEFRRHGYEFVIPPLLEYVESLLTGSGRDLDLLTLAVERGDGREDRFIGHPGRDDDQAVGLFVGRDLDVFGNPSQGRRGVLAAGRAETEPAKTLALGELASLLTGKTIEDAGERLCNFRRIGMLELEDEYFLFGEVAGQIGVEVHRG